MTLNDVLLARKVLIELDEKLEFATAYKVAKFIKATETEAKLWEDRSREIVETNKDNPDINEKLQEVLANEVDTPDVKFSIEDFNGIRIAPNNIYLLLPFMTT